MRAMPIRSASATIAAMRSWGVRPGKLARWQWPSQISKSLTDGHGALPRDFGFEVTEARPVEGLAEVYLGDGDRPPLLRLRDDLPFAVVDAGDHPVELGVAVGAAHDVDVVF